MRDRLIATLVGMTVAMIAMYGIPRAYVLADLVQDQERREVKQSADLLAVVVGQRVEAEQDVTKPFLSTLLTAGSTIEYVDPGGDWVRAGVVLDGPSDVVETRGLSTGGSVTLSRSGDLVAQRVNQALIPLILIGLSLTAFAALVGFFLARRISRPFGELAQAAEHLGRGRFDVHFPHYRIPEAEAIGQAVRRASTQLDELVSREREFASNASHQLRTPITALRLQLEDLSMWPETPEVIAVELQSYLSELDRLSGAITEILDLSRGRRLGDAVEVDVNELLKEVARRWQPQVEASERSILHHDVGPLVARLAPGPVNQVLDVLIDNACAYGEGLIRIDAEDCDAHLRLTVTDEGRRTITPAVFQRGTRESAGAGDGHGLGLAIASEIATSLGGHLSLLDEPTTTFALSLPKTSSDPSPLG